MYYIYAIQNIKNKKIYIGKTINFENRKKRHLHELRKNKHHSIFLQRSYNKYKECCFEFIILFKDLSEELATNIEQFILDNYYEFLYNTSKNSTGGDLISYHPNRTEIIKKISVASKKQWQNPKRILGQKEIMSGKSNPMFNKKHTISTKNKISLSKKGTVCSAETRKKLSEKGKKRYMDVNERIKQSIRVKHRYENEEEILKTSLKSKEMWQREDYKEKMKLVSKENSKRKSVKIVCNGKEYDSILIAIKELSLTRPTITKRLKSEKYDNWYYVDKELAQSRSLSKESKEKMSIAQKNKKLTDETISKIVEKRKIKYSIIFPNDKNIEFESRKSLVDYLNKEYKLSFGTINNIIKNNEPYHPKKHIHKCLEGIKIKQS